MSDTTTSTPKTKTAKLGTVTEVAEGGTVVRPDGTSATIVGGVYVFVVKGTYLVDGTEVTVK